MSDGVSKTVAIVGSVVAVVSLGWAIYKDWKTNPALAVGVPPSASAPTGPATSLAPAPAPALKPIAQEDLPPAVEVEDPCVAFLSTGRAYTLNVTTIAGPGELGRKQSFDLDIEGPRSCVLRAQYQGWSVTLNGCGTGLSYRATRPGDGDVSGNGTCSGSEATGTINYIDAAQQGWAYKFVIKRH